ncbi:phosphoribosylglycinamide formyltransferase [Riemerella columbipharyngis]|uniref:Phosphoribosylglycinamide formyltransferase n=1 Tax=Riemerella columbipharyngis TaxID=1071918 RepID=A0A1G6ZH58_9FLAO|nr:phosphoribosylglycinamide formyltransferase [Riemerella columbipharyngis]SDE02034.1 phosphoribosylglycinamide formyltransferase-1 [Riemerella columbipharyngis]
MVPKNIVVLVSGSGTNLQRILDCIKKGEIADAKVSKVIADRECYGLERAAKVGIPYKLVERGVRFAERLFEEIPANTDLVVLAGFLSILSGEILKVFSGKILNIHPSLLPKFGGKGMWGMNVHQAVIDSGDPESGATVHLVTAGIDEGEIVLQKKVSVNYGDTAEVLSKKVHQVEYEILPKAISIVLN